MRLTYILNDVQQHLRRCAQGIDQLPALSQPPVRPGRDEGDGRKRGAFMRWHWLHTGASL